MIDVNDAELEKLFQLVADAFDDRGGNLESEDPVTVAVLEKVVAEVRSRGIAMEPYWENALRPIVERVDAALAANAAPRL